MIWSRDRRGWLLIGYAGAALFLLLEIATASRGRERAGSATTLGLSVLLTVTWIALMVRYQRDRRSAVGPALIAAVGSGSIVLAVISPNGAAIIPCIVALSSIANRLQPPVGHAYAAAIIAGYVAATVYVTQFNGVTVLSVALGLTFAYIATYTVARLRESEARAQALLTEVEASRDSQIEATALNERARIAREIHDVLAHTLAAEAVQLETARLMLDNSGVAPQALAAVERAHRLTREGLDEVRRAVSALRGDRLPGPGQLRQLVSDFETDTGVESDFRLEGPPRLLSSEAELAVYRTAQEALTNVRKHAAASRVEVALCYKVDGTELVVIDVAKSAEAAMNRDGYGLVGMRERAELLGGTLEAGPIVDGFRVRLWIPAR